MAKQKFSSRELSDRAFRQMWKEARKDPDFVKEMKAFVKASVSIYDLE
ncbi:MAG: hypothetical protein AABW68_03160 [archaeon]